MTQFPKSVASQEAKSSIIRRFRQNAEKAWLRLIRLYTYNTPVSKGKYRLFIAALKLCRYPPQKILVSVKDGRKLWVDLTTGMQETVFFHGECEIPNTAIARQIVKKGDTCIDAGASYGWYTTLFAGEIGSAGSVHAFEPVPGTFAELRRNYEQLGSPPNVFINNLALGDRLGTIVMNVFGGQPAGHASMAAKGDDQTQTFDCEMVTLDSYLETHGVDRVDFVKVDIEGAEMMLLNGAGRLFEQTVPPVILMEIALEQSRHFGYLPDDILKFLANHADYDFYAVNELPQTLRHITFFAPDDIGANVFCIPPGASTEIRAVINKYLVN